MFTYTSPPKIWVHKNIIIIGNPSETNMPDRRPSHASLETQWRPTCLIGDLDMFHRRPRHASSETHWRQTSETHWRRTSETHWRLTFLVGYRHAWHETDIICCSKPFLVGHVGLRCVWDQACHSPIKHIGLLCQSSMKHVEVSDQACRSPIIKIFSGTFTIHWSVLWKL